MEDIGRQAQSRGVSLFVVAADPKHPNGGGSYTYRKPENDNSAIDNARSAHTRWEQSRGHDPAHDWRHTTKEATVSHTPLLDRFPPTERMFWETVAKAYGVKTAAYLMSAPPGELVANRLSREMGAQVHPQDITPEVGGAYMATKQAGFVDRAKDLGSRVLKNPYGRAAAIGTAATVPAVIGGSYLVDKASDDIRKAGLVAGGANFLGATAGGLLGARL